MIENTQEELDTFYNDIDDNEAEKFEKFLKERTPPMKPEKMIRKDPPIPSTDEGDEKVKPPTKKQIKESLKQQSKRISQQAEQLKKTGDFQPDYEYIEANMNFFYKFLNNDCNFDMDMNITQIMHNWTNFKYSPFSELRTNYIKQIGERVVCVDEMSKLFKHNFMTYVNHTNYRFDSLSFELCKFIGITKDSEKVPFNFEYAFIHSMLSKLLICMLSTVDRCFADKKVQLNVNFKKAIKTYLNEMAHIIGTRNKISTSWEVFEHCLLVSSHDSQIYTFKGSADLKEKLIECWKDSRSQEPEFLLEQLIGNTLKTFIPTVAYSYFMVIKNIYIMGRLISIYMNKKMNQNKTQREIMYDFHVIASTLTIDYEVNYLANLNTRSAPVCTNGEEMNKQTEMYYINHLISGPQYYILKQLELSLPTIVKTMQ